MKPALYWKLLLPALSGVVLIQLDLDEIAHVADDVLLLVLNLADEIELRTLAPPLAASVDHRARNLHRNRHEISGRRHAEIIDLQRQRQVRDRIARRDRFLQLLLLILAVHLAPDFGGPVTLAVLQACAVMPLVSLTVMRRYFPSSAALVV